MAEHIRATSRIILGEAGKNFMTPTVTCTPQGELIAVVSGNRDGHVCPFGQTLLVRSSDQGSTWSQPQIVNDTPLDDRDAGILALRDGTLVLNWFTSLYFEKVDVETAFGPGSVARWRERIGKITPEDRKRWLGYWSRRSTDGGHTWEETVNTLVTAPHGGTELSDGRLLMLGNISPDGEGEVAAVESTNQGRSWHVVGTVPVPARQDMEPLYEPHVVETAEGRLIVHCRYGAFPPLQQDVAWQSESEDGGRTWSLAHPTPIVGHPPHLLRLRNGWLLNTHGYRHPHYAVRACLSRDGGDTWDIENELILRDDSRHWDLGYPATTQLPDGSFYTVHYQPPRETAALCALIGTHWSLE